MIVLLALLSAVSFGAMTVAVRFGLRACPDPELGALATTTIAFLVVAAAAGAREGAGVLAQPRALAFFALAGLIAPGLSQLLFTRAVREAGPSRASVVVGTAPLFAAAMAIVFLGESLEAPLAAGAALIVLAGLILASESERPETFRSVGVVLALATTILFSARDNLVRWYGEGTALPSLPATAAALGAGALLILVLVAAGRGRAAPAALASLPLRPFLAAGFFFGLSYLLLFEAYYRGRVVVVSPLVATESLWGVLLSALLLGKSELVGRRLVVGAALVVAGGALISVYR